MKSNLEELKTTRDFLEEKLNAFVERENLAHVLANFIPILEDYKKRITELEKRPTLEEIEKDFKRRGLLHEISGW